MKPTFRLIVMLCAGLGGLAQPGQPPQPQPQPGPGEPRALKAYLGLSDEQLDQMRKAGEAAHKAALEKVKALQPQLEQKRMAVHELLSKTNPDAAALGKAMLEMRAVEKQIGEAHDGARKGALSVLSAEQRTKFKAIEDAALLPQATREAIMLGLTPVGPGQNQGPQPMRGQPNQGPNRPRVGQGRNQRFPGPNGPPPNQMGPNQPGPNRPGPQPMRGPGPMPGQPQPRPEE